MTRRALLTDRERDLLGRDIDDLDDDELQYRYQAASRVRSRVSIMLEKDIAALENGHPDLLAEIETTVCERDRE